MLKGVILLLETHMPMQKEPVLQQMDMVHMQKGIKQLLIVNMPMWKGCRLLPVDMVHMLKVIPQQQVGTFLMPVD